MKRHAFAPGHVSGLFAVHDEASDPLKKGSRGAGWSVDLGAAATVEPSAAMRIRIDGAEAAAPVTRAGLATLAPGAAFHVDLRIGLPVGQGFGMSAAGTLAACLAASSVLGLEPERALEAAHVAEVQNGTGLGDAVGSWFGAGEIRMKPGCPPHGWATRVEPPEGTTFLFAVVGGPVATPGIIRDPKWKERTRGLGDPAVDRILAARREKAWPTILEESHRFSLELGLMPPVLRALGERLPAGVAWGQSMLGATLWATGPEEKLDEARRIVASAGRVIEGGVDGSGARMVRSG